MDNLQIANVFYQIAAYLEMDDVPFKPAAYRKAARNIEALPQDLAWIYHHQGIEGLEKIPGVGEAIAEKIIELVETGQLRYLKKLQKKIPVRLEQLMAVEGVGPKIIKVLYKKLNVRTVNQLEKAARSHRISRLPGFGIKKEQNILKGIEFLKQTKGRYLLGEILPLARSLQQQLEKLKQVRRVEIGGSIRRRQETIGDVDLLAVASEPKKVMDFFVRLPEVKYVYGQGLTRTSVRLQNGCDVDLRLVPPQSFGSAWQYFTGDKEHNIITRKIAIKKGLKLNEYGVFRKNKYLAGREEADVYKAIGLKWMPPEIRTNNGEIEAAQKGDIPQLIQDNDIKGDLQVHSNWSDGVNSLKEMAEAAKKMGYQYLGFSDHAKSLQIASGMDEKQIAKYVRQIQKLNKQLKNITLLAGVEANVLKNGQLDVNEAALKKLDFVCIGIHSNFKMSRIEMTKRILRAVSNKYVNIFVHPTGRIIQKREGYDFDFQAIVKACLRHKVALEINAHPSRLDLSGPNARRARALGAKLAISTDSHDILGLSNMEYGVATARRGWIVKKDVINAQPLSQLKKFFKK